MKEHEKLKCNCCGKYLRRSGEQYEAYLHIVKRWGY